MGRPEHRRQDPAGVERHLRAGAEDHAVVLVPVGDADERLDRGLLHPRHLVLALKHVVGRLQRLVDVAQLHVDVRRQVALGIALGERHVIRLVMDDRRARLHAVARVEHRGQLLELDFDQRQRALGDLLGLGRDRGDPVAHVAHLAIQADEIQRAGDGVRLARGGEDHARHIEVGQHRMHAGQRARLADVDVFDGAVCDRAVQDFADQHAAHLDVGDERGLALGQLDRIDLRLRHADVPGLGRRREDQLGQIDLHLRVRPRAGGLRRLDRFRRGLRQFHQVDRRVQAADHRRGFLAAQPGGRAQHRLHRPDVAAAPAQHAGERLAHLVLGRDQDSASAAHRRPGVAPGCSSRTGSRRPR